MSPRPRPTSKSPRRAQAQYRERRQLGVADIDTGCLALYQPPVTFGFTSGYAARRRKRKLGSECRIRVSYVFGSGLMVRESAAVRSSHVASPGHLADFAPSQDRPGRKQRRDRAGESIKRENTGRPRSKLDAAAGQASQPPVEQQPHH